MPIAKAEPMAQADYDAIEAAVMETARGRWFLAEHARRQRAADTQSVLTAIGRLESLLMARPPSQAAAELPPAPMAVSTAFAPRTDPTAAASSGLNFPAFLETREEFGEPSED